MDRPTFRQRIRAAVDALAGRVVSLTRRDHTPRVTVSTVTAEAITSALQYASNGDLRQIGAIYDLVPATDSHIRGVRRQLIAGVTSIPAEVVPFDDSPEAAKAADLCKRAVDAPDSSMRDALTGIIEGDLRGESLTEIIWSEDRSRWIGFRVAPQQRLRYDIETGALRVALKADDQTGTPLSEFPGKFLVTIVDRDVPDFALRGLYRSVLEEWLGRLNVSHWEMQAIERHGMPYLVGTIDKIDDKKAIEEAFSEFGSAGALIITKGTTVDTHDTAISTTGSLVHETYLEKSAQRISVAFLGSQQTVTVGTDQGSKASASVSALVRRDVLYALWQLISEVIRRDLFTTLVRLNLGEQYVHVTPRYVPQFDDPIDMGATADALIKVTRDLGLPIGRTFAYESLGAPEPAADEEVVKPTPVAAPVNPFASFGAGTQRAAKLPPQAKPPRDAGAEITDPIAKLLDGLGDGPNALEGFAAALEGLEPADVPQLGDRLAADLAKGYLGARWETRKAREAKA